MIVVRALALPTASPAAAAAVVAKMRAPPCVLTMRVTDKPVGKFVCSHDAPSSRERIAPPRYAFAPATPTPLAATRTEGT
jgi:hypothetical protein